MGWGGGGGDKKEDKKQERSRHINKDGRKERLETETTEQTSKRGKMN